MLLMDESRTIKLCHLVILRTVRVLGPSACLECCSVVSALTSLLVPCLSYRSRGKDDDEAAIENCILSDLVHSISSRSLGRIFPSAVRIMLLWVYDHD
jgi:hypothetical protein